MLPLWLWPGWDAVYPNLLASLLWATPAFITQHLALKRMHHAHWDRHLEELRRLTAPPSDGSH